MVNPISDEAVNKANEIFFSNDWKEQKELMDALSDEMKEEVHDYLERILDYIHIEVEGDE